MSELHQHKLHVCGNNWLRRIAGVKRVERRRMKDLREEVGTKSCIAGKIVKGKGTFYIAQYPVRWTAQSALHL